MRLHVQEQDLTMDNGILECKSSSSIMITRKPASSLVKIIAVYVTFATGMRYDRRVKSVVHISLSY